MSTTSVPTSRSRTRSVVAPGVLLGVGMGGFVDGIVLHQILQWHHLLSTTERWGRDTVPALEANVLADGLFHAATWLAVAVGLAMLWQVARDGTWRTTWRSLLGWMLVGWGGFNLVEGTVNHHLLQIHRVRPAADQPWAWDLAFLVLGVLLVAAGWALQRADVRRAERRDAQPSEYASNTSRGQ